MKKKIKFLTDVTVNDVAYAAGDEAEFDVEVADTLLANGEAELVEVVEETVKEAKIYTFNVKQSQKTENKLDHFSKEFNFSNFIAGVGTATLVEKESVKDIYSLLSPTLFGFADVSNAAPGRYQDIIDIDTTELAGLASGCALSECGAPTIWGMTLGKYGCKVPLCEDDLQDIDALAPKLKSALRMRLTRGVDAGILVGDYGTANAGLLGIAKTPAFDGQGGAAVTVTTPAGATTAVNVYARYQEMLSKLDLPLQHDAVVVFTGATWALLNDYMAANPTKCCTLDKVNRRIDTNPYYLSNSLPTGVDMLAAFMPAYQIRRRYDLHLETCRECAADTQIFKVSARMTGRLVGTKTGAFVQPSV